MGQEEGCITNFAELENALLSNHVNQYQIASAYLPPKHEISPVCVIITYYIGIILVAVMWSNKLVQTAE